MDLFEKIKGNRGPLGRYQSQGHGYFFFPKLEGEIGPHMTFRGKKVLTWSINNYLGLANHPEVRKADAEAAKDFGMAYPMGARMLTGNTNYHTDLETELAEFVGKKAGYLLNYGYQGIMSIIDSLVDRRDVIVYDSESHASILDGLRLHMGKRFVFPHNNMENLEIQLNRATKLAEKQEGGVLVITEGVFGMAGDLGNLPGIVALKQKFDFKLLIDDAHGFGTMGKTGAGTDEHFGVQDQVDLYFSTFAKSMAGIGGFIAANDEAIIDHLRYSMRSQIYAKSLPMPMVLGAKRRLELLKSEHSLRENLWTIVNALQKGLKENGFDIGKTQSPVTPVFMNEPLDGSHIDEVATASSLAQASNAAMDLRENYGIFCSVIVYPVVPKGVIIFRIIPTAAHSLEDVDRTISAFKEVKEKLTNKKYNSKTIGEKIFA